MRLERTAVITIQCSLCQTEMLGIAQPELWLPSVGDEVRVLAGSAYGKRGLISRITNAAEPIHVSLPAPFHSGVYTHADLVKLPDMFGRAELIAESKAIASGWKKRLNLWVCNDCENLLMVLN